MLCERCHGRLPFCPACGGLGIVYCCEGACPDLPTWPQGIVVGPCVCGSWPGGPCLHCPLAVPRNGYGPVARDT